MACTARCSTAKSRHSCTALSIRGARAMAARQSNKQSNSLAHNLLQLLHTRQDAEVHILVAHGQDDTSDDCRIHLLHQGCQVSMSPACSAPASLSRGDRTATRATCPPAPPGTASGRASTWAAGRAGSLPTPAGSSPAAGQRLRCLSASPNPTVACAGRAGMPSRMGTVQRLVSWAAAVSWYLGDMGQTQQAGCATTHLGRGHHCLHLAPLVGRDLLKLAQDLAQLRESVVVRQQTCTIVRPAP